MIPSAFFHKLIFYLNLLLVLGTIGCYLAPWISPVSFWPIAFLGLGYPVLMSANLLFVLYWILFRKRLFWISLVLLLIGIPFHDDHFRIGSGNEEIEKGSEPFRIMSFNVRLFGLYEWGSNKDTRDRIFRFLEAEDPELICFQEFFYSSEPGYFDTRDTMQSFLKAEHYHDAYAHQAGNKHFFGIASFSEGPILERGQVEFPNGHQNICIYSDILLRGDTVRVYNAHFASIRSRGSGLDSVAGWSRILRKLKRGFIQRAGQVERVVEHVQASPHPVILCTDLNDTPSSYAYQQLASVLEDSFIESGSGLGRTYIGKLPSFRIDYIFHSEEIHSFDFETLPEELSDHRPIQCRMQLEGG